MPWRQRENSRSSNLQLVSIGIESEQSRKEQNNQKEAEIKANKKKQSGKRHRDGKRTERSVERRKDGKTKF